ncbi:hypothetical protein AB0M57_04385 [Streptomyces sp. NPDC051597]|uniref:hypothetical protein n=1 Tax=Streptomyces sp. NPDC051597 TaxID=3155049 RepID=UPI00343F10D2
MSARSTIILAAQGLAVLLWLTALAAIIAAAWWATDRILTARSRRRQRQQAENAELARRYRPDHLDLHQREEGRP